MREKAAFRARAVFTAVLTGWVLVAGGASASAGGPEWTIEKSPNLTVANGQLESVSCSSATACTAVGNYLNQTGIQVTLAERWNGRIWRQQRARNPATDTAPGFAPSLLGVSCPAADFCEAVGAYQPDGRLIFPADQLGIAEEWNGRQWRWQRLPIPVGVTSAQLDAVSCTSPRFCEAVGSATFIGQPSAQTLAERWNGSSWRVEHTPNPPPSQFGEPIVLNGVSCASPTFCEAVGGGALISPGQAVAERWNGRSWRLQAVGASAQMNAVSCVSARFCEAVGSGGADRWNGKSWKPEVLTTAAGSPSGVSCTSPKFCEAVAQNFNIAPPDLAAVWNGSAWKAQATPSPAGASFTRFLAVACVVARSCKAVGIYGLSQINATPEPLAEAWTGHSWRLRHAAAPLGATFNALGSVSCVSATFCETVGGFAARWNGTSWRIQATPAGFGAIKVSCVSVRFCEAVGVGTNGANAAEWNGTSWRLQTRPGIAGEPEAVSCATVKFCMSVDGFARVDIWNGSSWSAAPSPTGMSFLGGVSCLSATFCEAVGSAQFSGSLAATWNGSSWSTQAIAGPVSAGLDAIWCTSVTSCEAVGSQANASFELVPLAELWNGTAWSVQAVPSPPITQQSFSPQSGPLVGLSCTSATACTAVGSYQFRQVSPFKPYAEVWNGTSWSLSFTPSNANASSFLSAVSCSAADTCTAVGQTADDGGIGATLIEAGS